MRIGLLGIPFNGDGTSPGEENPAAALREAGLAERIRDRGHRVRDFGDLEIPPFSRRRDPETRVLNLDAWIRVSKEVAEKLPGIYRDTDLLVVLGGDCSILLGIFGAFRLDFRRIGLVFFDGHTDYRDPRNSPTGEPADLELAVLTGRGPGKLVDLFGNRPLVNEEDVVVYGYREPDEIETSELRRFDRLAMSELGARSSALRGLDGLTGTKSLWLHFDVDVLDPTVVPVNFPEPDGLSPKEATEFLGACLSSHRFIGLSVACYHPRLDEGARAAGHLLTILSAALTESG